MIFKKLNSLRTKNVNISDYLVDWDGESFSKPHITVRNFLREYWINKTVLEEFQIPGSKLRIDIFNVSDWIAVEVSPEGIHTKYTEFMHKTGHGFLRSIKRDMLKRDWCKNNEISLVELDDSDIKNLSEELFRDKFGISL